MLAPAEAFSRQPWYRLRLPRDLEAAYQAQAAPPSGRFLQSWLIVFIVFNLLSMKVDLDLFGPDAAAVPVGLTVGVFLPVALAAILALRGRPSVLRQSVVAAVTALTDMAIVLNSARIAPAGHAETYLVLAAVVTLVVGLVAPMPFRHSLWFCTASFALFVLFVFGFDAGASGGTGLPLLAATLTLVPLKLSHARERDGKHAFLLGLKEQAQAAALEAANLRLKALAVTDPLTGLANRRLLTERLECEWEQAAARQDWLCVVLIDLDHFKLLNDTSGHAEGDHCLERTAEALREPVERVGGMLARHGGEEFVAVLPSTPPEVALKIGERLRGSVVGLGIWHPGLPCGRVVTASVGVTSAHGSTRALGIGPTDLLKAADRALYEAKRGGRNRVEEAAIMPKATAMPTLCTSMHETRLAG